MKVLVLGYYGRQNLGDEMFSFIFEKYFEKYWGDSVELVIKNMDDLKEIPDDVTTVICGGGDLINDYFLRKIHLLVDQKLDYLPVYAIGMGIPYPNMIEEGALDCFDFIAHRNKIDEERLLKKYDSGRVKFFPDLGFLLPGFGGDSIISAPFQCLEQDSGKKIGVFLSKTIFHPNQPEAYEKILDNLAYFLVKLAREKRKSGALGKGLHWLREGCRGGNKYQIYLIPSSTNPDSTRENDQLINQDLYQRISTYGIFENIHVINQGLEMEEILPVFKNFYFTICTRFHAHIFSILAQVPVLSISSSRKVESLLAQVGISEYGIQMPVDPDYLFPVKLDCWPLFEKYHEIVNHHVEYTWKLNLALKQIRKEMRVFKTYLKNLLLTPVKNMDSGSPAFGSSVRDHVKLIAERLVQHFVPEGDDQALQELSAIDARVGAGALGRLMTRVACGEELRQFLSEFISFFLTRQRRSVFNYGLYEQVLTPEYHLHASVEWILREHYRDSGEVKHHMLLNRIVPECRKLNLHFFKQHDLAGYHRSGWSYVVKHLEYFHDNDGPIFDSFLDKTFGWDYDFYMKLGVLPLRQDWVGVFHHTPDESYSVNNLTAVFEKAGFLESLQKCRGIYVLSEYLARWLRQKLEEVGFDEVLVNVLTHPTEFVEKTFNFERFVSNKERRVIQIGAWMRNSYAIYQLPNPLYLRKTALKGKDMDNYYPHPEYLEEIKTCLYSVGCACDPDGYGPITRHGHLGRPHGPLCEYGSEYCNKYMSGLYQALVENQESVEVMDHVSDLDYDCLLSRNVALINLVDASAVNTILECIVRNTPILVNRLPAVVEYLGPEYPLYYESLGEAHHYLNNFECLKRGHEYLRKMDKTHLTITHFLSQIVESEIFEEL